MLEEKIIRFFCRIFSGLFFWNNQLRKNIRKKLFAYTTSIRINIRHKLVCKYYKRHIERLKNKKGKIRIGFLVSENQKWNCQSLYDELSKNNKFEPVIILTLMSTLHYKASTHYSGIQENIDFFEKKGIKVEIAYDIKKKKYISLKNFNCDIIFYQQPWFLHYTQEVYSVAKFALTAYVPYCFHMLEEENNYFAHFHKLLWCYFVESKIYEKKYKDEFNAKNVFFSGHTKLDNYLSKKIERPEKQIIIYAPHHYNCDHHKFATWHHNGKQLLEFAQEHQEFEWFFKPHPHFKDSVIRQGLLTEEKAVQYFNKWEKIGTVYTKGDYYPLFKQSSLLITDCISFLAEYMPTENPVFFLKSDNRIAPFTELGEKITSHYYQITDWKIFEQTFERVVKNNDDYLKSARLEDLKSLIGKSDKSAAQNILDYLEGELQ